MEDDWMVVFFIFPITIEIDNDEEDFLEWLFEDSGEFNPDADFDTEGDLSVLTYEDNDEEITFKWDTETSILEEAIVQLEEMGDDYDEDWDMVIEKGGGILGINLALDMNFFIIPLIAIPLIRRLKKK